MKHTGEEDIRFTFNYCPPPIDCSPDYSTPLPDKRLTFHDRHLDERLLLRRVLPLSTLIPSLSGLADEAFEAVLDSGLSIPDTAESVQFFFRVREYAEDGIDREIAGADGVSRHYKRKTSNFCIPVATALLMRPLNFDSMFMWNNREREEQPFDHGPPFILDGYALTISRIGKELLIDETVFGQYDTETQDRLRGVLHHCPVLGTWQIYPPTAKATELIRDMDSILLPGSFTPRISSTAGFRHYQPLRVPTGDAAIPWVSPPLDKARPSPLDIHASLLLLRGQPITTPRRSSRLRSAAPRTAKSKAREPIRTRAEESWVTPALPLSWDRHRAIGDLVQHGWNQAVIEDSTFIVFTNGVSERIGIRDRATQTLFLSDHMTVSTCDPPYARVQIGLHIAAYRDAVDRYIQIRNEMSRKDRSPAAGSSRVTRGSAAKRGSPEKDSDRSHGPAGSRKKRKISQSNIERLFTEASSRDLLLVRLVHGIYNSVTPSSFVRSGPPLFPIIRRRSSPKMKALYPSTEYVTITLGPALGEGSTGVVHDALLEVALKDGSILSQGVVAKLAVYRDQQERMRHEFAVYERLAAAAVAGIPGILGIFEDIEGTANLLIMNHCGRSLAHTHLLEDRINVRVSEEQKAAFLAVIDAVHKAGVRHRDMRAPNLLLNDDGEAVIIDFDRAELDPPEQGKKREYLRLKQLLDGHFTDADAIRTP